MSPKVAIESESLKLTRCLQASCYARRKFGERRALLVRRGNAEILRAKRNLA